MSCSTQRQPIPVQLNANDKLIYNNWIYYIAGSCCLIHVPKAANLHSPTRIRRHFWKRGYFSAVFQKVCIHLKRIEIFFAPKSAETMQEKLRPLPSVRGMMNDIILFENHSAVFGIVFLYPQEKNNSAFPKPPICDGLKPCATFFVSRKRHFVPSIRVLAIWGGNLRIQSTCGRGHGFTVIKLYWSCYEVVRIEETGNHVNCFFAIYRIDGIHHLPIFLFYFILFFFYNSSSPS